MVVKVYVSGISGNKEVKKRQQRVQMILESKHIDHVTVDITEPGNEQEKEFMQANSCAKDDKHPLPPQMFNEQEYCGGYDEFDLANENDELEQFLKVAASVSKAQIVLNTAPAGDKLGGGDAPPVNGVNGNLSSRENSAEKEAEKKKETPAPLVEERREEEPAAETEVERTEDKAEVEEDEEEEEEEEEGASEQ